MELPELLSIFSSIIIPLLALYGAIISTYNFFNDRKKEKPQIEITTDLDLDWKEGEITAARNLIIARNIGIKPVTFASAYIEEFIESQNPWWKQIVRKNKKRIPGCTTDPYKFENGKEVLSGKCLEIEVHYGELYETFGDSPGMKLIAVFIDQIGNRYQSEPFYYKEFY